MTSLPENDVPFGYTSVQSLVVGSCRPVDHSVATQTATLKEMLHREAVNLR